MIERERNSTTHFSLHLILSIGNTICTYLGQECSVTCFYLVLYNCAFLVTVLTYAVADVEAPSFHSSLYKRYIVLLPSRPLTGLGSMNLN